jgi:type I restriction enzyme S subunit
LSDVVIPNGWCVATIMDVATSSGGGTPSKSDSSYWIDGTLPWVSPKDMKVFLVTSSEDQVTAKALERLTLIPKDSILVVVRSGILSRTLPVAINQVPVTVNQDMRAFVPEGGVDARYIAWQFISQEQDILDRCAKDGTTVASIEGPALATYPLAIAPPAEQTRIVEKLEELLSDLDAGVAELKAAQRKLAQYRQSLLKAAVEGALTTDWRAARASSNKPQETGANLLQRILTERRARWEAKQLAKFAEQGKTPPKGWQAKYPEPAAPDTSDLPDLPDGWTWASVDQCALDEASITDGPFGSNLKSAHYTENGPRVLRLQNIGDGHFVDAKAHISEDHYETLTKHAVAANDVVVAMLGEILPRACIVPDGIAPAIVKADCARIRLNPELLTPALLNAILNAEPTRKRVARLVKGIGRPRVNLGNLRSVPIPLPPIDEQRVIRDALKLAIDSADQQDEALEQGFRLVAAQRKNILKAAFAGQLVPQDPNDEPASVLLELIRAERPANATTASKRDRKRKDSA